MSMMSGWQTFSIKDKIVNISGIVGYTVSVPTTQPYHYRGKAATDDTKQMGMDVCSDKTLFIKRRWDALGPQIFCV